MKIHVRYNGRSTTLESPRELQPEEALAYLQKQGILPFEKLEVMTDRHPDGLVIRPPAVFG
jgi:hypothetical protein